MQTWSVIVYLVNAKVHVVVEVLDDGHCVLEASLETKLVGLAQQPMDVLDLLLLEQPIGRAFDAIVEEAVLLIGAKPDWLKVGSY
jgi:hypothetical protein